MLWIDYTQVQTHFSLLNDAGFKRGLDEQHLKQSLSDEDQDYRYSFKFALDRLAFRSCCACPCDGAGYAQLCLGAAK